MNRQRVQALPRDPALALLQKASPQRPVALLHSGRPHPRWARRSLFAQPIAWFTYRFGAGSELVGLDRPLTGRLFDDLKNLLHDPDLPGRWFGYLGYEIAHLIEPAKLGPPRSHRDWPVVELGYCPAWEEIGVNAGCGMRNAESPEQVAFDADFTRGDYEAAVRQVIDYIAAGDVFQVNLAQRLSAEFAGHPRELFQRLAAVSPAWYGAYVECGLRSAECGIVPERALLSTSPELFLEVRGRDVITRPIKGTRPNSELRNPQSAFDELQRSEKDLAELNMIVDLMRNDLGKVCDYGSVKVQHPREIETHPTVHHGVATITGRLHESMDVVDLLKAALPGGSITGAPKVRAMQIIGELEPHARGPYCGCIGYLSKDEARLNVAIRTMLLTASPASAGRGSRYHVDFGVGGGIVADSQPADEYNETLAKAQAMLRALGCVDADGDSADHAAP